jgi:hypothetical protein
MKRRSPAKRGGRKKKEKSALSRHVNRAFIVLTLGLIALYVIPVSTHVVEESDGTAESAPRGRVTVRLLNGCGAEGIADRAKDYLRQFERFDVVEWKNAPHFKYEETEIVALTDNREAAEEVRELLGFGRVVYAPDSTQMLDLSITLGSDSRGRIPKPAARAQE